MAGQAPEDRHADSLRKTGIFAEMAGHFLQFASENRRIGLFRPATEILRSTAVGRFRKFGGSPFGRESLTKGVSAGDGEAAEAIRDPFDTVTVFRDPARPGGVAVEIAGRLNALPGEEGLSEPGMGSVAIVGAGERIKPPTEQSGLVLQQAVSCGDGQNRIVRFGRPDILFYDEHMVDLYHRICALYRMG